MDTKGCVTTIYNERSKFIVIGLTGRTGSGCSEAADILGIENFDNLNLRTPKNHDFKSKEERKYRIVYNYAKNNWGSFYVLRMSDIIFSFILQYDLKELSNIFEQIIPSWKNDVIEEIMKDSNFVDLYNKTNVTLNSLLNESKTLLRKNSEQLIKKYQIVEDVRGLHEKCIDLKNVDLQGRYYQYCFKNVYTSIKN